MKSTFKALRPLFLIAAFNILFKGICDENIKLLAAYFKTSVLVVYLLLSLLVFLAWSLGSKIIPTLILKFKSRFNEKERASEHLKEATINELKSSSHMRFLLLSGYTMFHDIRENYIYETIKTLHAEKQKFTLRVLMLDPETELWSKRAKWFLKEMENKNILSRPDSLDEYKKRCIDIMVSLKKVGAIIRLYDLKPIWRLHIFNNYAFLSAYTDQHSGHLTNMYRIQNERESDSLYQSMIKYFDDIWKKSIPFGKTAHVTENEIKDIVPQSLPEPTASPQP